MEHVAAVGHAGAVSIQATEQSSRILIVDDHPAVREGIRAMLESVPNVHPVATATGGRQALRLASEVVPDVVVLDFRLADLDGLSVCLRVKASPRSPAVVLYSAFADADLAVLGIIAGADALVHKNADPDLLATTVHDLASGQAHRLSPSPAALQAAGNQLHADDLPILGMLAHRTPVAEIARTLGVEQKWLLTRRWAMLERLTGRRTGLQARGLSRSATDRTTETELGSGS